MTWEWRGEQWCSNGRTQLPCWTISKPHGMQANWPLTPPMSWVTLNSPDKDRGSWLRPREKGQQLPWLSMMKLRSSSAMSTISKCTRLPSDMMIFMLGKPWCLYYREGEEEENWTASSVREDLMLTFPPAISLPRLHQRYEKHDLSVDPLSQSMAVSIHCWSNDEIPMTKWYRTEEDTDPILVPEDRDTDHGTTGTSLMADHSASLWDHGTWTPTDTQCGESGDQSPSAPTPIYGSMTSEVSGMTWLNTRSPFT